MIEKLVPEKKILQAALLILLVSGAAVTANTLITGNTQPDGYALNVTTLQPTAVKPTEAEFRANVTEKSSIYDAALVYWNYTNTNTGETYRGPANITSNKTVVNGLQPGLKADTAYDVNTYVEPVVWEDQEMVDNILNKSNRSGLGKEIGISYANNPFSYSVFGDFYANDKLRTGMVENLPAPDISSKSQITSTSTSYAYGLAFSPDGEKMFVSNYNGGVTSYSLDSAWDISSKSQITSTGSADAYGLAFSPDGEKMFVSAGNGDMTSYSLE